MFQFCDNQQIKPLLQLPPLIPILGCLHNISTFFLQDICTEYLRPQQQSHIFSSRNFTHFSYNLHTFYKSKCRSLDIGLKLSLFEIVAAKYGLAQTNEMQMQSFPTKEEILFFFYCLNAFKVILLLWQREWSVVTEKKNNLEQKIKFAIDLSQWFPTFFGLQYP